MSADFDERFLGGPVMYFELLKSICASIRQSEDGIADHHFAALYRLLGKTLPKALDLIDKDAIEYVTVASRRSYFIVRRPQKTYYLYSTVLFCDCPNFQFNHNKRKKNWICKHIAACHIALAAGKCQRRTSTVYMWPDLRDHPIISKARNTR